MNYYVAVDGNNSNPGTIDKPWKTITYAVGYNTPAKSGDFIYVKAGNYGKEYVDFIAEGVSLIGYSSDMPDVIEFNIFKETTTTLVNRLPVIDCGNRADGRAAMNINGRNSIAIKNFYITNVSYGINAKNCHSIEIQNVAVVSVGDVNNSYSGRGIQFGSYSTSSVETSTINNCIVLNSAAEGISVNGDQNEVLDCHVYCDEGLDSINAATDYYILINGNRNTIARCYVERIGDLAHKGHGITLKWNSTENLVEDCTAINMHGEGFSARHSTVANNEFSNCYARGGYGIVVRDGANINSFHDFLIEEATAAFRFTNTSENTIIPSIAASSNKFENITVINSDSVIGLDDYAIPGLVDSNLWSDCTFTNCTYLISAYRIPVNNIIDNCTISDIQTFSVGKEITEQEFLLTNCTITDTSFDDMGQVIIEEPDTTTDTTNPIIEPALVLIEEAGVDRFNEKCNEYFSNGYIPIYETFRIVDDMFYQQFIKQ